MLSIPADPPPRLAVHRSRALISPFAFHRPADFATARRLLDATPGAQPMAGGLDLVNRMKDGYGPAAVVWLGAIEEGDIVERLGDMLVAGALVRHDQMARADAVREGFPELAAIWARIANIRIRSQGTVVGNILAAMPAYEAAILLGAVGARLAGLAPGGAAFDIPVTALTGPDGGALPCPGLVTAFRIPLAVPGRLRRLVYDRALRPALSMALCLDMANGTVAGARAVLGGGHARPLTRAVSADGLSLPELARAAGDLARAALTDLPPFTAPFNGHADYRARVAPVLLARLIEDAAR